MTKIMTLTATKPVPTKRPEKEATMDSAPVTPQLLEAATRWNMWSWWGLTSLGILAAVAAIGTVTFTFVQGWSSNILSRQAEWRTANLEKETARANESAALANERAAASEVRTAELQKEAEDAKLEQEKLKQQLAWRRLDADQMEKLIAQLTGITFPVTLQALASDPEAAQFAADIAEVFKVSGIAFDSNSGIMFGDGPIMGIVVTGREDEIRRIADPFLHLGIEISGQRKDANVVFYVAAKPQPKQ